MEARMITGLALALASVASASAGAAEAGAPWVIAGRQGIVVEMIVPVAEAKDPAAYRREIRRVCADAPTCFVNFFTNEGAVPLAMPLPEAIRQQPVAVLRRSGKQGAELFRWSCRLAMPEPGCF